MEWYLKVVRDNYANFNGRARRQEFWMFILFNIIISIVAGVIDEILGTYFISGIYSLAMFIPSIAVSIRRLHDINKSGVNLLLVLIPVIGLILIYFFTVEGDREANKYGNPTK